MLTAFCYILLKTWLTPNLSLRRSKPVSEATHVPNWRGTEASSPAWTNPASKGWCADFSCQQSFPGDCILLLLLSIIAEDCFPWGFFMDTIYAFNINSASRRQLCPECSAGGVVSRDKSTSLLSCWTPSHLLRSDWDLQVGHKSAWIPSTSAGLLLLLGFKLLLGVQLIPSAWRRWDLKQDLGGT